jgi:acetyl esterase/lipase
MICVGGDEILRDDSVGFAEKAKGAGVDVTLRVGEGLFHCFPVCAPLFPEATQAMDQICAFIKMRVMHETDPHNEAMQPSR